MSEVLNKRNDFNICGLVLKHAIIKVPKNRVSIKKFYSLAGMMIIHEIEG